MTENDDLMLPPRRPLPSEVRDRLRATVLANVQTRPRSRLDRVRPPLAVAASVAVLAAGAAIVAQSVIGSDQGSGPVPPTPSTSATPEPPPLDPAAAAANLDRCWAAVRRAGKAAGVPDRTTWVPVFAVPNGGRTVTAVRAGGKPLFCETTRTTVTVSDPNATPVFAKGSGTAALMISKDGGVGGIADAAWKSMAFLAVSPAGASGFGATFVKNGLWIDFSMFSTGPGSRFTVRQTVPGHPERPDEVPVGGVSTAPKPGEVVSGQTHAELDLPAPPPPLAEEVDRPDPAPERSSEMGVFLSECIANSNTAVVDPDAWQPVAVAGSGRNRTVLARAGDQVATCTAAEQRANRDDPNELSTYYQFSAMPPEMIRWDDPLSFAWPAGFGTSKMTIVGLLSRDVATMEIVSKNGDPIQVPITNGAFGLEVDTEASAPTMPVVTVVLKDAAGKEIFRGHLVRG